MSKKNAFSDEYVIDDGTDIPPSAEENDEATAIEPEKSESLKKIEEDYDLTKPRREIFHARIIDK